MRVRYDFSAKRTGKSRKPAHMNKHRVPFPKMVKEIIRTSDIILEVLDARNIEKTRNKELENEILTEGKRLIFVLNKSDLVDINEIKRTKDFTDLIPSVFVSCKEKIGRYLLKKIIKIEVKKLKNNFAKARVGIIGYPNTGKSSLINLLAGGGKTRTSPEAGFTTAIKKIRFNKDILILDTPGVIPDNEYGKKTESLMKKHVEIGIKTYDKVKDPEFIINDFMLKNPGILERFYNIDSKGDTEIFLEELGKSKNFLKKHGIVDTERTARMIIKDIQQGKIKQ